MRVLYFDCFSGISGDMFLSTLVDLGVPEEVIQKGIASLGLPGLRMEFGKTNKNGIDARTFHATVFGEDADTYGHDHKHNHGHAHSHNHGHDHHHEHEHDHHHHHGHGRTFRDIQGIIENSDLTQKAKNMAIEIFRVIAVAEGKIHGATPEEVHFHEVGAYDSIADIVGAAVGIDYLNPDRIEFSPLPMTRGFVKCNHGVMPLPAPATAEIVKDLPIIWEEFRFEMVTPTGAGIAKVLGAGFGTPPKGALLKTGYGAGKKTYERPNVVRGMLFQVENGEGSSSGACSNDKTPTDILEIEMNIDDMTGETMGYVLEKALAMGALDSWSQPIFMKKGRPAYKLSFLIKEADLEKFTEFLLRETSSFGFRYSEKRRVVLERSFRKVESVFGDVTLKEGRLKGEIVKRSLEYEDCKRIAMEEGLPLIHVLDRIEKEI